MKRIKIAIIILAAVVLAAIGVFLIANYFNNKSIKEAETEEQKLVMFDFNEDDINKIEINNGDGSFIAEYNSGSGWALTNSDLIFNEAMPNSICSNLSNLKAEKILESTDKSKYGFDDPVKITAYTEKESYTVFIGDPNPTYDNYYAMKENDENIYLINFSAGAVLSPSKDDLKYRYIYPYSTYEVTHFALWNGKENDKNILFSMSTDSSGAWAMDKPYKDNSVYYSQVNNFLVQSSKDAINSFVQENCAEADYAKYGFDNPNYVFEISTADDTTKVIFGNYTDDKTEIYGLFTQSGQVVTFLSNSVTILGYKTADMMNTVIFSADISKVMTAEITMPDAKAALEISDEPEGYSVNEINVDENAMEQFMAFFNAFNGTSSEASEAEGEPSGEAEITVEYFLTNNSIIQLKYIPITGSDNYWVTKNGSYTGYVVNKSAISKIISSYEELAKAMNLS